jgi:hypothetical protein
LIPNTVEMAGSSNGRKIETSLCMRAQKTFGQLKFSMEKTYQRYVLQHSPMPYIYCYGPGRVMFLVVATPNCNISAGVLSVCRERVVL